MSPTPRRPSARAALPLILLGWGWAAVAAAQEPPRPPTTASSAAASGDGAAKAGWYSNAGAGANAGAHGHACKKCGKCGCIGCYARPYETASCLYGYHDYVFGRGPTINLGGAALEPGFRGYGVLGSPGFGLGIRPSSRIDAQANARGWRLIP